LSRKTLRVPCSGAGVWSMGPSVPTRT